MTIVFVLSFLASCGLCIPLVQRSLVFDDVRVGEKLTGQIFRTEYGFDRNECVTFCLFLPECKSFNFFERRICEFNSGDVFSTGAEMKNDSAAIYQGMRQEIYPECFQKGLPRNIQNDRQPNLCRINQKRQDAECSDWTQSLEEDSVQEWKKITSREIVLQSHGGITSECVNDKNYEVLEWFYFIHSAMIFNDAVSTCSNSHNAEVFYRLNGTKSQLEFLDARLSSDSCFWLGIKRVRFNETATRIDYVDIKGTPVPYNLIVWSVQVDEPSNRKNEKVLMGFHLNGVFDYVHDSTKKRLCLVVCDKI